MCRAQICHYQEVACRVNFPMKCSVNAATGSAREAVSESLVSPAGRRSAVESSHLLPMFVSITRPLTFSSNCSK
jgi:hypothetical protein